MVRHRILSRRDLDFLLFEWLGIGDLLDRPRFHAHSTETISDTLTLAQKLAETHFAPYNALVDRQEPSFDGTKVEVVPQIGDGIRALADSALLAAAMDESVGGGQLPATVHRACLAWFMAANVAAASYSMLTLANANLLLAYGDDEQVERYVLPMMQGRFSGTMCISEPQAGSSLTDIATTAVREDCGRYRLRGAKMWISCGDHELTDNIVHLVLARVHGAPQGVKGLSLFLVPKTLVADDNSEGERNDVIASGLNHKMGYRGTVNTALNFGGGAFTPDGAPGAIGYLIGAEGKGLDQMFHMMNEARIDVGLGAASLAYTGYAHALAYARQRLQGRPPSQKDPRAPQVAIVSHPDVRRMLLAAKCYAEGSMALVLYAAYLLDEQLTAPSANARRAATLLLDVLTPIVKSWPSTWGLAANDIAIQVHGGCGYTRDFPVEQFYRDNRLNAIHEGTTGIQALDLLGRKVRMSDGAGLKLLVHRICVTAQAAPPAWKVEAHELRLAATQLADVTAALWSDHDAETALANATVYLEAAGHIVVAWIWLSQALAAERGSETLHEGKRVAARYFFRYELPRVWPQLTLLESRSSLLIDLDDACL